ncbi:MAG: type II toxin-antitoxin system prevent-host-death family antitoxin [Thermomicrobiales bacterium]|nr:type II toxin-antitoxin system prevent-host-death family antitoxin [Thermomicrobiales bacterium]
MREQEPGIQTIQLSEVKGPLLRLVSKVSRKETRVLVENAGEPVAALVSAEDLRRLNDLDRAWDERTRAIERFSKAFADVPADEAEADMACIIEKRRKDRAGGPVRQPA